jgi:hypothetical protein
MNARVVAGLVGFVLLGLSPSFVDWQQSPEKRGEIAAYYLAAITLLYIGVLRD